MRLIQCGIVVAALAMAGCGVVVGGSGRLPSDFSLLPTQEADYCLQANSAGGSTVTAVLYDAKGAEARRSTVTLTTDYDDSGLAQGNLDLAYLSPGRYSMQVYFTDQHGVRSNTITKKCAVSGGLRSATRYEGPANLGDTALGDLNGDGRNDIAAIEAFNNSGTLRIYYGNSTGTLEKPRVVRLDMSTTGVAIADVNNDGKADLIVAGVTKTIEGDLQGRIAVLLQEPATGELLPTPEFELPSEEVAGLVVADVNGDGTSDIVAGVPGLGMVVFFQNSTGTFTQAVFDKGKPVAGSQLRVADMDGDGRNDIVFQSADKELAVMRQTAPGVFSAPELYAVETSNLPVVLFDVADINGDGRADLVTADPLAARFTLLTQNRHGKLDRSTLEQPLSARGVKIADITGDGLNDLVFRVSGGITVLPQQADHSFGPETFYTFLFNNIDRSTAEGVSIGTMTGDGRLDVFTTSYDAGLYQFPYTAQVTAE